jgi:hypothetical protein
MIGCPTNEEDRDGSLLTGINQLMNEGFSKKCLIIFNALKNVNAR